jgi:hypothetical protein
MKGQNAQKPATTGQNRPKLPLKTPLSVKKGGYTPKKKGKPK